ASPLRSEASRALRSRAKISETPTNPWLLPPAPTHKIPTPPPFHSLFYTPTGLKNGSTPHTIKVYAILPLSSLPMKPLLPLILTGLFGLALPSAAEPLFTSDFEDESVALDQWTAQ